MSFGIDDISDQSGRTAVVTGANTGIGFEVARALAARGAHVVLACRNEERAASAVRRIEAEGVRGRVEWRIVDLASLESVRVFAEGFMGSHPRLDLLINNAAVMIPPESKTQDGFEMQFGVNYLGHFALTLRLFPEFVDRTGTRIVTLGSLAHRNGRIDFENLRGEKRYHAWREYQQSKLACLMFVLELEERLRRKSSKIRSVGSHPGISKTELQRYNGLFRVGAAWFGMKPEQGALPTLYAATSTELGDAAYFGPHGVYEGRGHPAPAKISARAHDRSVRQRLWSLSEELTGLSFQ